MRYKNLKHNTFFFAFLFFNLQIYQRQRDGRQDDLNFFLLLRSLSSIQKPFYDGLFFRWTLGLNNRKEKCHHCIIPLWRHNVERKKHSSVKACTSLYGLYRLLSLPSERNKNLRDIFLVKDFWITIHKSMDYDIKHGITGFNEWSFSWQKTSLKDASRFASERANLLEIRRVSKRR